MNTLTLVLALTAVTNAATTISNLGGDCATYIPGNQFTCKSGLICVIKNAPPTQTPVNTLGGTCANPPSVLPTVAKDPNAYGNTKDFDGCVKDTTKACDLSGWSSDSVAYLCKADEKKWISQDVTPLYVCHVDGSASSGTAVVSTRAATVSATGVYSGAAAVVAGGFVGSLAMLLL
ncbi:hypothetical protein HDU99_008248 [Rhizoclosmatium hyalinum]|nr:hypothetical protein HDU99_008248 [Rhizoclosmatium hyalinum]